MDNTLIQSRKDIDPVLKEETRKTWEQNFQNYDTDNTYTKSHNTYKGAVVQPYEKALAQHQDFASSYSASQGVNGNAFDTTLTRYSPNVAEQINF